MLGEFLHIYVSTKFYQITPILIINYKILRELQRVAKYKHSQMIRLFSVHFICLEWNKASRGKIYCA
jgi:hypothetical protein